MEGHNAVVSFTVMPQEADLKYPLSFEVYKVRQSDLELAFWGQLYILWTAESSQSDWENWVHHDFGDKAQRVCNVYLSNSKFTRQPKIGEKIRLDHVYNGINLLPVLLVEFSCYAENLMPVVQK
jgi:hypothetical protein